MKITRSSRSDAGCPGSWLRDGKHMVPFSELETGTERTSKTIARAGTEGHTQTRGPAPPSRCFVQGLLAEDLSGGCSPARARSLRFEKRFEAQGTAPLLE
ncbi:hypothetical protein GRJ2_002491900 [Grus japonensis]|uniref:Uncharacterized protein n=1 Tax=Grus japonensis TaxID=30415 RepID=A0ABC9XTB8_GRUJA